MPKAKPISSLSGLIDTDMEDDTLNMEADGFPTPDSNQENAVPVRKRGGRVKATAKKFTKTKIATRRVSSESAAPKKAAPKRTAKRAPLKVQSNGQRAEDTEEVYEFKAKGQEDTNMDELVEFKQAVKPKAPEKKVGRPAKNKLVTQVNGMTKDGEFEYTPTAVRQSKGTKKPIASHPQKPNAIANTQRSSVEPQQHEKTIPETQVPMDIGPSGFPQEDDEDEDAIPQSVFRRTNNARSASHQRQAPIARRRADSASDTERGENDPTTRKKLGEMTKKFDSLELKYRRLRETGIKEADANFAKYKAQSQAKAKAADELIACLQKEISTQKSLSQDSRSLEKQIIARDADLTKTQALADQLSTSLSAAQNENKVLQAKLANSRSASVAVESINAKTPASAMRGRTPAARNPVVGSAAQVAQLKEILYSDLTGLILRGVEMGTEADIYDCIQTGRNGTLHFKLGVAKDIDGNYENTEFQYTPRLDMNRDRDLIALLPEYLTDEITFSRTNAAMFYGRVVETLTKKRSVEE